MNIQIIGSGTVGFATGQGFDRIGHSVVFYDIDKEKLRNIREIGFQTSERILDSKDVTFICVPESEVDNVIEQMKSINGIFVIRSTVEPGTTIRLMKLYNKHIIHNPEFLRESTADFDFMNPDRIVIGECCSLHGDVIEELYEPFGAPVVRVDSNTSEMVKLASNAYLSTLISYWNEIHRICRRIDVNSHQVGITSSMDKRISRYGASMHGRSFGGACLPKDLDNLIRFSEKLGLSSSILQAVKKVNEGMIK